MPGFLPTTRPLSASYGPDMVDDDPVVDPNLETPAARWNDVKADLAFVASVAPLAIVRVDVAGGVATKVRVRGLASASVTVTIGGLGFVQVDFAGITVLDAEANPINTADSRAVAEVFSATRVNVRTYQTAGGSADMNFLLKVY